MHTVGMFVKKNANNFQCAYYPCANTSQEKKKESKQVKKVYELDRIIQIKIKVLKMFFALQEHGTPGIFIYNIN